jgi:hypothetical protein
MTEDYAALAKRLRAIASAADFHEDSPIAVTCREAASACDALAERQCKTCASQDNRYGDEMPWCQNLGVFCSATHDGGNAWSPKGGTQ